MAEIRFPPVPPEPAHPMVVKLHDDLVALYTHIRDGYQARIDEAFDRVSRDVGFVVATALPYTFEVGDGRVKGIIVTDGLQDTLFDRELTAALKPLYDDPVPVEITAGSYGLYLFWFEALRLRLRTDWMEPAHQRVRLDPEEIRRAKERLKHKEMVKKVEDLDKDIFVRPRPWEEPAHWFDPGIMIAAEEKVLISVIDEVYPELRLADRVGHYRRSMRRTLRASRLGGTMADPTPEPAQPPTGMLEELAELLHRYGY
jgi:hypothetical protein